MGISGNTVKGILTLTSGGMDLNQKTLIIDNAATGAVTRAGGYIVSETNTSGNTSIVQWNIASTTGSHVFPFGTTSGSYIPVTFNNSVAGSVGNISISTRTTAAANTPFPSGVTVAGANGINATNSCIDRWWEIISSAGPTTPSVALTLTYQGTENSMNTTSTLGIQHWTGTGWNNDNGGTIGSVTTTGSLGALSGLNPVGASFTKFSSSASHFLIVILNTPLPIELLDFTASCKNQKNLLNWSTTSETNNDYFTVEKSADALNWFVLSTKQGAGNSNSLTSYSEIDNEPYNGNNYYRLKQTDFDGKYSYSDVVKTSCEEETEETFNVISLTTGERGNEINLRFAAAEGEKYYFSIFNNMGQRLKEISGEAVAGSNEIHISNNNFTQGIYLITLQNGTKSFGQKVFLK